MHLSKLAAKYEAVRLTFKGLSSIGFTLLNVVAIFVFLALAVLIVEQGCARVGPGGQSRS